MHDAIEVPKDPMVITALFTPIKDFLKKRKRKKGKLNQLNSSRKRKKLIPPDKQVEKKGKNFRLYVLELKVLFTHTKKYFFTNLS